MSAYSAAVLADTPDCYYRLDETGSGPFVDQVAANNLTPNATIVSVSGLIVTDAASPATQLDHAGSFFKANSTHTVSQRPLTVEFWVTPQSLTGFGGTASVIASCAAIGNGWQTKYLITTGRWRFTTTGVADYDFTTAPAAQIGVKQHVVFVFKVDNSVDLYIDGAFQQNVTGPATINATTGFLALGDFGGGQYPQAIIDELAVYTAALSAGRIAAHYAAATAAPVAFAPRRSAMRRA